MTDHDTLNVPHIGAQLAEYLKGQFSADAQIAQGLLSDTDVTRSEGYLLGFLAGLAYAQQIVRVMVDNQEAFAEESDTLTRNSPVDVTGSWLDNS